MGAKLRVRGVDQATRKLSSSRSMRRVAAAAFTVALTGGLTQQLRAAPWEGNAPEWAARKGNNTPWLNTGKLLAAINNNPIVRGKRGGFSGKKRLRFTVDARSGRASIVPMTFSRDGKRVGSAEQLKIYYSLQRGSKAAKMASVEGAAPSGGRRIPGRPLFRFLAAWERQMTKDINQAIEEEMKEAGYTVR